VVQFAFDGFYSVIALRPMGRPRFLTASLMPITAFVAAVMIGMMGLSLLPVPSFAQERAGKLGADIDKTAAPQPAKELKKIRKQRAVLLVKEFANRAFSFEDTAGRVLSIARFASRSHPPSGLEGAMEACRSRSSP
jgi:hypothetical protein